MQKIGFLLFLIFFITFFSCSFANHSIALLNASYDPTRELYEEYNKYFKQLWQQKTGQKIIIHQSHGGSGAQARAVIDGLQADVVTLALAYDIDKIAMKAKLLPLDWQKKLPNNSCPYTSTIIFVVRKANPKHIHDWPDLIRSDVKVITANPKTSGGARWNYLAAWGYALKKNNNNENAARDFVTKLYKNVPILDAAARGSANTFAQRDIGDVLITWENEAFLVIKTFGADKFEMVIPSISILTEPPVAVVEVNTQKKGSTQIATAYLQSLYTPQAQEIIAQNFFRPYDKNIAAKYAKQFAKITFLTIAEFGGWQQAQKKFFDDGALFDQIYGY